MEKENYIALAESFFSENLKDLRKEKKFTQKQLAEKLGVPVSTYANWEQGRTQPSIYDIFNLLLVLDVGADELFDVSELKKR